MIQPSIQPEHSIDWILGLLMSALSGMGGAEQVLCETVGEALHIYKIKNIVTPSEIQS